MTTEPIANISKELGAKLSPSASIHLISSVEDFDKVFVSWSAFNKKEPSAVVKIATEEDAVETVLWATSRSIPFAVKGGGHSIFCTIGKGGIIIDLTKLNKINVHEETVDVQGGVLIGDLISAVSEKGRCVVTGTCDKVGVTGALLGGGVGPVQGIHGMMIDNLVSARVVTAEGKLTTVSETENTDLFWALRGAGQRFGLVTQVTLKTYDVTSLGSSDGSIWNGTLVWEEHQLEQLTEVINTLKWDRHTAYFGFFCAPPAFKPTIITFLVFFGTDEEAEVYLEPLLSLGPLSRQSARIPYSLINTPHAPQQELGGYKSQFCAGVQTLNPKALVSIYKKYSDFIASHPDAHQTAVIVEVLGRDKVREVNPESTAFPHRDVNFWAFLAAWYHDPDAETEATNFGNEVRQLFRDGDSSEKLTSYINFNRGDESLAMTYGSKERIEKLLGLKEKWDPRGVFGKLVAQLG